jgi:hypothetical protein
MATMTAKAIDRAVLTSTTNLSDLQRAQLAVVGKLYFGEGELPRIAEDDSDGDPLEAHDEAGHTEEEDRHEERQPEEKSRHEEALTLQASA